MSETNTIGEGEPWKRCPSTHCERRQECASPSDCMVKSKAADPRDAEIAVLRAALAEIASGCRQDARGPIYFFSLSDCRELARAALADKPKPETVSKEPQP